MSEGLIRRVHTDNSATLCDAILDVFRIPYPMRWLRDSKEAGQLKRPQTIRPLGCVSRSLSIADITDTLYKKIGLAICSESAFKLSRLTEMNNIRRGI